MTEQQAATTRLLCRALGPFLILLAIAIFARYETIMLVLPTFAHEAPLILVTGVLTLLVGCLMFAAHHHFNSAAAIAVSVLALIFIIRGAALAIIPDTVISMASQVSRVPMIFLGITVITGAVGIWLSVVGWFAKPAA